MPRSRSSSVGSSRSRASSVDSRSSNRLTGQCEICGGPHSTGDCPHSGYYQKGKGKRKGKYPFRRKGKGKGTGKFRRLRKGFGKGKGKRKGKRYYEDDFPTQHWLVFATDDSTTSGCNDSLDIGLGASAPASSPRDVTASSVDSFSLANGSTNIGLGSSGPAPDSSAMVRVQKGQNQNSQKAQDFFDISCP